MPSDSSAARRCSPTAAATPRGGHIVPRNHGGSDDLSNLQALCFRCNAAKRDTDSTDFRGLQAS